MYVEFGKMVQIICEAETETQCREETNGHQGEKRGMNWEAGIDIHTLLCVKHNNEDLLNSTGNTTQCPGDLNGKEIQKRGDTCTCGLPRWRSW